MSACMDVCTHACMHVFFFLCARACVYFYISLGLSACVFASMSLCLPLVNPFVASRIWGSGVQAQGFQGMHKTFGFAGCRSNLRELGMKVRVCVQRLAILTPTNLYRNSHIEHFDPGITS